MLVFGSAFTVAHRDAIVAATARHDVPAVYETTLFAPSGGVTAPTSSTCSAALRIYVGRILKDDKPGDLPVQQPTKFDLVINLKTAKALSISIAPALLAVIE
jgi:putative ABC transport system substrate-binding protein